MKSLPYSTLAALKEAGFTQEKRDGTILKVGDTDETVHLPTMEELIYDLDRVSHCFKIYYDRNNEQNPVRIVVTKLDGTVEPVVGGDLLDVLAAAWLTAVAQPVIEASTPVGDVASDVQASVETPKAD